MWRWVIKDYFSALSWYRVKERLKKGDYFWGIYMVLFFPMTCGMFTRLEYAAAYYLMLIPMTFCMEAAILHKSKLPKIFYICPMERDVRKAYIERKFFFAILFPTIIGAAFSVILLGLRLCHPLTAGLYFFDIMVMSIFATGIFAGQMVEVPGDSTIQRETVMMGGLVEGLAYVFSLLGVFGMSMMLSFGPSVESWCKWIFFGVAVLILLPLAIKGLTGWNAAVERALSYEVIKIKAVMKGRKS